MLASVLAILQVPPAHAEWSLQVTFILRPR